MVPSVHSRRTLLIVVYYSVNLLIGCLKFCMYIYIFNWYYYFLTGFTIRVIKGIEKFYTVLV